MNGRKSIKIICYAVSIPVIMIPMMLLMVVTVITVMVNTVTEMKMVTTVIPAEDSGLNTTQNGRFQDSLNPGKFPMYFIIFV